MKILFFGDINGKSGRRALAKVLPELRRQHQPDLVVANAENLAHGKGLTLSTFREVLDAGVDFLTSGNHVFDKPEGREVFSQYGDRIIRPANFPDNLPGKGYQILTARSQRVAFLNLNRLVFMEKQFDYGEIGNPFLKLNELLDRPDLREVKIRILDFHAEATSEKRAMGFWADGRMSAVLGTHTHVPTADAHVLPRGTGYLTDLGMVGAADSVIGVQKDTAIERLLASPSEERRAPLLIDESDVTEIDFAVLTIDEESGKCQNINSFRLVR